MPQKLGKYEIIEEIGRGGFAVVYKALDTSLNRTVALKVLRPHYLEEPGFVTRFQIEAQTAAGLFHPNIVTIFEVSEVEGAHLIAMRYLDGQPLSAIIQEQGPLDLERAMSVMEQTCLALDYIHSLNLVHRDVKSSNIIVGADGHATLTDFGIVRAADRTRYTTTGASMGTPEYMPPEQGQGLEVTPRSDIYSLGVVLYEMLAGKVPFEASTPLAVMMKHVSEPPPPIRDIIPGFPRLIEAVIQKALAKGPEQRYAAAGELAEALGRAVTDAEKEAETEVAVGYRVDEEVVGPLYAQASAASAERRWQEAIDLFAQILAIAGDYRDTLARLTEASKQRRSEALLAEARQAVEEEQWAGAIDLCGEILSLEPHHEEADTLLRKARRAQSLIRLYAQAEDELARGDLSSALEHLEQVLTLDKAYRDAQSLLEKAKEELAQRREAAELLARGKRALERADWERAVEYLRTASSLQPEPDEALGLLAQAEAGLAHARELDSIYQRGLTCLSDESWSEAIKTFTELQEIGPGYRDSKQQLAEAETGLRLSTLYSDATAALQRQKREIAVDKLKELLATDPHYRDAEQILTQVEQELRVEREEVHRQERIAVSYAVAKEQVEGESWEAAIATLQQLLQIDPEHSEASALLAQARGGLARAQEVALLYEQAISSSRQENWAEAVAALTQLLELEPEHEQARELLVQAETALQTQERLEALIEGGNEALESEDWKRAIDRFEEILAIEPTYCDVGERLAQAQKAQELAEMYAKSKALVARRQWGDAIQLLQGVLTEQPGYRDAAQFMEAAQAGLAALQEAALPADETTIEASVEVPTEVLRRKSPSTIAIVGAFLAGLVLVAGGYLVVSRGTAREAPISESPGPPGASPSVVSTVLVSEMGTAIPSALDDVEEIMALGAESMADVQSFHFELETSGTRVYLEEEVPATLLSAEGNVLRPDSADMQAKVIVGGFPLTIRIIAVDQRSWLGEPEGEEWATGPSNFEISSFLGKAGPLDHLSEVRNMTLIGVEQIGGESTYHLNGSAEGIVAYLQPTGIVEDAELDIWIDAADFHPGRLELRGQGADSEAILWNVNLSAFGEPVVIRAPSLPTVKRTPGGTPTPEGMTVFDDLDDPEYWAARREEVSEWFYSGGQYHGKVMAENEYAWVYRGDYEDFQALVEVTAQTLEDGAGLAFRIQSANQFYMLLIDAQGRYTLRKHTIGQGWELLVDREESSAIRSGLETNRLKVSCLGESIALFANDQHLTTVHDTGSQRGRLGLVVYSLAGESDAHWSFDNLSVWEAPTSVP